MCRGRIRCRRCRRRCGRLRNRCRRLRSIRILDVVQRHTTPVHVVPVAVRRLVCVIVQRNPVARIVRVPRLAIDIGHRHFQTSPTAFRTASPAVGLACKAPRSTRSREINRNPLSGCQNDIRRKRNVVPLDDGKVGTDTANALRGRACVSRERIRPQRTVLLIRQTVTDKPLD